VDRCRQIRVAEAPDRLTAPPAPPPDIERTIEQSLPGISADPARSLAEAGRIRIARDGETIFHQGEEVPLILLLRGHGGFRRTTVDGQQVTVGVAGPGEMFGLTSASATISSVELIALLGRRHVVLVAHLLAPLRFGSFGRSLVDREVGHEMVWAGPVPVPLPGRRLDGVARADLNERAAAAVHPPDSVDLCTVRAAAASPGDAASRDEFCRVRRSYRRTRHI
jgi:hypothetical protein